MTRDMIGDIGDLRLELGGVLRDAKLAYVTYGALAPDGRNAILLTHGYTSSHHFAEGGASASEGSWGDLVGPDKPIDTQRYFVVSSNMIGSSYGSTAPRSLDPATGGPYGPSFPPLTLTDIVTAQRQLLDRLGVKGLVVVVGPSYGGYQAFAWGVAFPDFMKGLVAVVTGLRPPGPLDLTSLRAELAADPAWNGGRYDASGSKLKVMAAIRERTLRSYGIEAQLTPRLPDQAERDDEIGRMARAWSDHFDANSLLVLGDAMTRFDATPHLARIRAKVLYVLSRTDEYFPPSLAPGVMSALHAAGVAAAYVEIDSEHGHLASGADAAKWEPALRRFLQQLHE